MLSQACQSRSEGARDIAIGVARKVYFSAPAPVQKLMLNMIPGQRWFKGQLRELERSQWFSARELGELQGEKLRAIVRHAYVNVPYYRRAFDRLGLKPDDIRRCDELEKLPVMTKDDVREHFEELQAVDMAQYKPYLHYTGGSTGTPLKFYNDEVFHLARNLVFARFRHWFQLGSEHPRMAVMRYRTDFPPADEGVAPHVRIDNDLLLSAFHLKSSNLDDYIRRIRAFKPELIWSFASTLYVLAQHMQEKRIPPIPSLRAITTSAETLFPHFRQVIEKAFGARVYDHYGCNEGVVSACECPQGSMHIDAEYAILEVVDANGRAMPAGKPGIVVGTSLNKFAMPLLRYRLGDLAALSDTSCACGRGLPVLASLEGRLDDLVVAGDGRLVGRLDEAFHGSFGIKMSQIVQEEAGSIVVRIVKRPAFAAGDIEVLDAQLKKRLGNDTAIEYKFVDDVERTARGKYRFVLSRIGAAKLYK